MVIDIEGEKEIATAELDGDEDNCREGALQKETPDQA